MNNIKSNVNEAVIISGGSNKEGVGLQVVSKGKQLYVGESSYLFFSDSEIKNAFHFKTRGGFLIDSNEKNQFHINNTGLKIFCINSNCNFLGNYKINIRGESIYTYEHGNKIDISGGNYEINLKENLCNFLVNLRYGDINFNNFSNFNLIGNLVSQKINKFELNSKIIEYKIREQLKINVGDYGIDISENIGIVSGGKLNLIGLNGNVELVSRNGEILKIENERPNGEVHIKGSNINGKIFITGNLSKLNVKDFLISCENYNLTTETFNLKSNFVNFNLDNFLLDGLSLTVNVSELKIGEKLYIGEKIKLNGDISVKGDDISVVVLKGRLEIKELEIESSRFFLCNRNEKLKFGSGIIYNCENTSLKVNVDEIGLISGGNMGILISGEKGGIRMLGDFMWNYEGYQLLSTDIIKKEVNFGNDKWRLRVDNLDVFGNVMINGIFEGNYGMMKEKKDENSFKWIFGNGLLTLSPEKIVIVSDSIELDGEINVEGKLKMVGDVDVKGMIWVDGLDVRGSVMLGEEGNRLELGDGIRLGKYMEMGRNIKLDCENNFLLNVGGDYKLNIEMMDLKINKKFENIGDYYGIIKGEYNLQFIDGFIKVKDGIEIVGEKVRVGLIKMEENNIKIDVDKLKITFNELDFGKIAIGKNIKIGEEKNGILITDDGLHLMSKYGLDLVSLDRIEILGKMGINMEGRKASLKLDGCVDLRGDGVIIGKKMCIGWDNVNLEDEKNIVLLGGEGGKIILRDGVSLINGKILRVIGNDVDINGDKLIINYGNCRMNGDNLWMKGKLSEIMMGEDMEIRGKIVTVKVDEDRLMELGQNMRVMIGDTNINLDKSETKLVSKNVRIEVGERFELESSRDIIQRTVNGDISFITKTGNILMDGISKKIGIESDYLIEMGCKRLNISGELRYRGESVEFETNGMELRVEGDIDIKCMGSWDGYFGESINLEFSKLGLKSDKYGELSLTEDGLKIETNKDLEILGDNMMGELRVYHRGFGRIEVERGLEIGSKGGVNILGEEGLVIGSEGDVRIVGKGELRIHGNRWKGRYETVDWEVGNIRVNGGELDYVYRELRLMQEGGGILEISGENSVRLVDKFEGHKEGKLEIISESNTHEGSILIKSRVGGIRLDGQSVNINGILRVGKVRLLNMEDTLKLEGMLELDGLRLGRNMFIESRGISLIHREEVEMINMDINLDGNIRAKGMTVGKIDGGRELEMLGKVRVNNGLEIKGCFGVEMDGIEMGKWERGNRVALNINLEDTIWSEGIRIKGKGRSLDVEGDVRIDGVLNCSEIKIKNERKGKTRELEDNEIEKMLEDMDVEIAEDGELIGGSNDMIDMIKKMMAIIKHQSKLIKKMI